MATESPVFVYHPHLPGVFYSVQPAAVDAWTDAGWLVIDPPADYLDHAIVTALETEPGVYSLHATIGGNGTELTTFRPLTSAGTLPDTAKAELVKELAPVGLGRSVADFGASPTATATANWEAFTAAVAWTQTNPYGAKTVFIPALGPGQYFELIAPVEIPAGVSVIGANRTSRVRSVVKPNPCFRTSAPNTRFRDFSVHGLTDRFLPEGGWERENHKSLHYAGITFQANADGGLVENVFGQNLACVANAWAYDENTGAYAGKNINGLTFRGIEAKDVWGAVFVRETDNLLIEDISGTYSRPGGGTAGALAAPAHLVYVTSSSALAPGESPRKLRGVTISNIRARGGTYGAAFAFKHVVGGTFNGLVAEDCEGLWDLNSLENVTIGPAYSVRDKRPWSHSVASMHILKCKKTIVETPVIEFAAGDHGRALFIDAESSDVTIRNPRIVTNHTVTQNSSDYADIGLYGTDNRVERPSLLALGQPRNGIAFGGTRCAVTAPSLDGVNRGIQIMASAVNAQLEEFDPARIKYKSGISTTFWKADAVAGSTFTVTPSPRNSVGWDRQTFALGSARAWNYTTSGHPTTLKGSWRVTTDSRVESFTSGDYPRIGYINTGNFEVEIESDVWLGGRNVGGAASLPDWAGHAFRAVNTDTAMAVELHTDAVKVTYFGVPGGVYVRNEIATVARNNPRGRRHRLRTLVYTNTVQVFIDGALVLNAVIPDAAMQIHGAATNHGYAHQLQMESRFRDLTITAL